MSASILLIVLAYLIGSLPTAYLVGRFAKGIDIRLYGTGHVGGSNIMVHVGPKAAIAVVTIDVAKGAVATGLAHWMAPQPAIWTLAALAAVTGHCWSLFLGFSGGRGTSTAMGSLVVLDPLLLAVVAVPGLVAIGLTKATGRQVAAELTTATLIGAVVAALWLHGLSVQGIGDIAVVLLLLARRLVTKTQTKPKHGLARLLLYRLVLDRDVASRDEWIHRHPTGSAPGKSPD